MRRTCQMNTQNNDDTGPAPAEALRISARRGERATVFGILASSVLAAVKILAGVLGNSYALIADGIESMLDILSSLAVWGSLRIASRTPDEHYPYGYGKAEPLAALVVAIALLAAAAGIAVQSIREILTPQHAPAAFTLVVLIGVVVTKEVMFRVLSRTGSSIRSKAMETDAWHHRSDALTSIAAFFGISIALIGGDGYESADDWAALCASFVIAYNGVRLFRSPLAEVLDVAAPPETENRIRTISETVDGVRQIEKCRIRKSGLGLFIDIHTVVDGAIPVYEGHTIAHQVKNALLASDLGVIDVTVHIEPDETGQSARNGPQRL